MVQIKKIYTIDEITFDKDFFFFFFSVVLDQYFLYRGGRIASVYQYTILYGATTKHPRRYPITFPIGIIVSIFFTLVCTVKEYIFVSLGIG
jgi:hypothetical protein